VLVVAAAADTGAVEARLRRSSASCCASSPAGGPGPHLDAVRAHLNERWEEWNLYELGETGSEDGQARTHAKLTKVLPEIAEWAASLPSGIVAFDPWLRHSRPQSLDP